MSRIKSNDVMALTKVVNFAEHSEMHLRNVRHCCYHWLADAMAMVGSDSTMLNVDDGDGDDGEKCSRPIGSLPDAPVRVPLLFVVAI